MSANLAWYWSREADGSTAGAEWFKGSLLQQPWMLQGYAQETLSLSRFVREVQAFARQPRPVRLLYSEASAIQDVFYLDALRDAYEALNFLGVSIGVVTERQLAEKGIPNDTRLVIVPNAQYVQDTTLAALRGTAARGVKVAILGRKSLTAAPTGGLRSSPQVAGAQYLELANPQSYHSSFEQGFKSAGITPELLALDTAGRPAWGIEMRTALLDDRRLAYAVNLLRQPQTVTFHWRKPGARWRDWRTGTQVPARTSLAPRELIFGSY